MISNGKRAKRILKSTAKGVGGIIVSGAKKGYKYYKTPAIEKTQSRIKGLEARIRLQKLREKEKKMRDKAYGGGSVFGNI